MNSHVEISIQHTAKSKKDRQKHIAIVRMAEQSLLRQPSRDKHLATINRFFAGNMAVKTSHILKLF
jgi:predicted small secreted protein